MIFSKRWRTAAATAAALLSGVSFGQTWSACNPLYGTCPANQALGMTVKVDFTKGSVNSFISSGGTPTYDRNGVSFTVARSGEAPQLASMFYIMFGRVEVTMKAAPGNGIVSSLVLLSDTLDEIDMEWLGADSNTVQTNYFSKGAASGYNRGEFNPAPNNQAEWITYTIDWTPDRIVWYVGRTVIRTLKYNDANGAYPQTPMQVKFGAWSGGDYANEPGTIEWARGPTDYSKGPFSMLVKSAVVTDYSTGKTYSYGDNSGTWQSIHSDGGKINGNLGGAAAITVTASAAAQATDASPTIPIGGIGKGTQTNAGASTVTTWGSIPSGWRMGPDGKIKPIGDSTNLPAGSSSSPDQSLPSSSPDEDPFTDGTFPTTTNPTRLSAPFVEDENHASTITNNPYFLLTTTITLIMTGYLFLL